MHILVNLPGSDELLDERKIYTVNQSKLIILLTDVIMRDVVPSSTSVSLLACNHRFTQKLHSAYKTLGRKYKMHYRPRCNILILKGHI